MSEQSIKRGLVPKGELTVPGESSYPLQHVIRLSLPKMVLDIFIYPSWLHVSEKSHTETKGASHTCTGF